MEGKGNTVSLLIKSHFFTILRTQNNQIYIQIPHSMTGFSPKRVKCCELRG